VRTKEFHTRKIGQGDDLIQVGDIKIENLTLSDFKKAITTPTLGMEGYNVTLVFRKANGKVYRLPGEALRVNVLNENPEAAPSQTTMPSPMPATIEMSMLAGSA
jgi:hypothetical protein